MKFADEFRDRDKARTLVREIETLADQIETTKTRPLQLMEVCGGHTHSIFRYGLEGMLPSSIELVHGPGCPVCVLPMGRVDDCVAIAERPGVIFTTFGDAMRVPGSRKASCRPRPTGRMCGWSIRPWTHWLSRASIRIARWSSSGWASRPLCRQPR